MSETPKCPGCGAEMKAVDFGRKYLSFSFFCYECGWGSPLRDTAEKALSAALHRAEPDAICHQLSKALCGNGNATPDEMLEAAKQIKHRAEPENRPLTLDEVKTRCKRPLEAEPLFLEFKRGWKSYRFWPRKPTPEQMAAEKWEE